MSEAEFDSYLSLLSKFLRLRSRQRAELADELRDHLDSRLDELLSQGKSREQAIQIALDEFGDAAVLAEDFSRLASRRKRRFVMRCTAASAAVVAAVVLLSVAFAPPGPNGPGPQLVVAQNEEQEADVHEEAAEAAHDVPATADGANESSIEQEAIAELDRKLAKVIPEVKFAETPLTDVLTFVADAIEADMLIDAAAIEDEGLTADVPVTLSLTRTRLSARTVLDFVLQPLNLTFVNRAGVIYVTTETRADEHLTTKVYNVRDLLENAESHYTTGGGMGMGGLGGGGLGGMGGGGFFSVRDAAAASLILSAAGQLGGEEGMASGGMGMGSGGSMSGMVSGRPIGPAADLINAITHSTSGNWMDVQGAGGTLSLFNGLLVVRQTDEVHAQVQKLLDALREAGNAQPGKSVTVPKEKQAVSESVEAQISSSWQSAPWQIANWPHLGLTTVGIFEPKWTESSGKPRSKPVGLRIEKIEPDGLGAAAGFTTGDVVLSWSADKWSRHSIDENAVASDGHLLPTLADLKAAPGHGATSIVFAILRPDAQREMRQAKVVLPLPSNDIAD